MLSLVGVLAVAAFCLAVGIRDLRRKDYVWAALAFAALVIVGLIPIPTHAVKFDIPAQTSSTSRP
jgi:multisubunit Na+/H+ antiporter MnhB subunit